MPKKKKDYIKTSEGQFLTLTKTLLNGRDISVSGEKNFNESKTDLEKRLVKELERLEKLES